MKMYALKFETEASPVVDIVAFSNGDVEDSKSTIRSPFVQDTKKTDKVIKERNNCLIFMIVCLNVFFKNCF